MIDEKYFGCWECDSCGEVIQGTEQGWIEWLEMRDSPSTPTGRGLRLVHHVTHSPREDRGCQYDANQQQPGGYSISDLSMDSFMGPDGLVSLLAFLHEDRLPQEEVLEMIKRLHVPGYEWARFHFEGAISQGIFNQRNAVGYHTQEDIEATLRYAEESH